MEVQLSPHQKRVQTLLSKYGEDYFSRMGKKGFAALRDKYRFESNAQVLHFLFKRGASSLLFNGRCHNKYECDICKHQPCPVEQYRSAAQWMSAHEIPF